MTNKKLLKKGFKSFIMSLISFFVVPYILFGYIVPNYLGAGGGGLNTQIYSTWFLRFGIIMAGIVFIRDANTKDSWRYALGDLLLSLVGLIFVFKLLSSTMTMALGEGIVLAASFDGFFNIYLLIAVLGIIGKVFNLLGSEEE